jgi:glucose/arabinose dehydrogenase
MHALLSLALLAASQSSLLDRIQLPKGFGISYFARDLENARSMVRSPGGTLFVGTRRAGSVYALRDDDGDGVADRRWVIAKDLNMPNGVAFRDGALYVAEVSRVLRFDQIEKKLDAPPKPVVVNGSFPDDEHHGWKFIAFGPDGLLYVPIGAPCNVCEKDDPRYSSITRMKPDGSGFEVFARGVRNTVGFDWHPETKELWFTENGRDWLGDDSPPDELNRAPKGGMHFGFPYCHAGTTLDPDLGKGKKCEDYAPPVQRLGPHVAALGMRFYTGKMFPERYHNQIFIAEHGSWNRTHPLGYRVMVVAIDAAGRTTYEEFATGWLTKSGSKLGRPVDVLVMPDGSMLVSDDHHHAIYRITHR